jgi:hypothetical protein
MLVVLSVLTPGFSMAGAIGLRGGTWGELRYDIPKEGEDNLTLDGWIKQGIDWKRWGNTTLNTYAALRYKFDTEKYEWNNTVGPGIGISLDMYSPRGLILTVGAEYSWESLIYDGGDCYQKTVFYVNWVGWWDLKRR